MHLHDNAHLKICKKERLISWNFPGTGWTTFNTDGSCRDNGDATGVMFCVTLLACGLSALLTTLESCQLLL